MHQKELLEVNHPDSALSSNSYSPTTTKRGSSDWETYINYLPSHLHSACSPPKPVLAWEYLHKGVCDFYTADPNPRHPHLKEEIYAPGGDRDKDVHS